MYPLKKVVIGDIEMVGKVELDSTLPIVMIVRRRRWYEAFPYVGDESPTGRRSRSPTDFMIWKPGFKLEAMRFSVNPKFVC